MFFCDVVNVQHEEKLHSLQPPSFQAYDPGLNPGNQERTHRPTEAFLPMLTRS